MQVTKNRGSGKEVRPVVGVTNSYILRTHVWLWKRDLPPTQLYRNHCIYSPKHHGAHPSVTPCDCDFFEHRRHWERWKITGIRIRRGMSKTKRRTILRPGGWRTHKTAWFPSHRHKHDRTSKTTELLQHYPKKAKKPRSWNYDGIR